MSRDQDEILLGGVDSDLADRYRTAKQKVRERTGVSLSIAGGGRSRERQQKYFEQGKTPYDGSNPNAPHPLGLALDLNWKRLPSNIQSVAAEELRNVGLRQGGVLANGYSEKHHWQLPAVTDGNYLVTGLDDVGSTASSGQKSSTISDGNVEVDFSPDTSSQDSTAAPTPNQSSGSIPIVGSLLNSTPRTLAGTTVKKLHPRQNAQNPFLAQATDLATEAQNLLSQNQPAPFVGTRTVQAGQQARGRAGIADVRQADDAALAQSGMNSVGPISSEQFIANKQANDEQNRAASAYDNQIHSLIEANVRASIVNGGTVPYDTIAAPVEQQLKIYQQAIAKHPELRGHDPQTVANEVNRLGDLQSDPETIRNFRKSGQDIGLPLLQGFKSSVGSTVSTLGNLADVVNVGPQSTKTQALTDAAQYLKEQGRGMNEGQAVTDLIDEPQNGQEKMQRSLLRGVGAMPVMLAKFEALGIPTMIAEGGLSRADEGIGGVLKGSAESAVSLYGMQATGKILSPLWNGLTWTALPTAKGVLIDHKDLSDALGESIPGGVLAGVSAEGIENNLRSKGFEPFNLKAEDGRTATVYVDPEGNFYSARSRGAKSGRPDINANDATFDNITKGAKLGQWTKGLVNADNLFDVRNRMSGEAPTVEPEGLGATPTQQPRIGTSPRQIEGQAPPPPPEPLPAVGPGYAMPADSSELTSTRQPVNDYRIEEQGGKVYVVNPQNIPDVKTYPANQRGRAAAIDRLRTLSEQAQPKLTASIGAQLASKDTNAPAPEGVSPMGAAANMPEEAQANVAPKTIIRHADPNIDGKPVVGKTNDGRLIVENENNKSGVSIVQNPRGQGGNRNAAIQKVSENVTEENPPQGGAVYPTGQSANEAEVQSDVVNGSPSVRGKSELGSETLLQVVSGAPSEGAKRKLIQEGLARQEAEIAQERAEQEKIEQGNPRRQLGVLGNSDIYRTPEERGMKVISANELFEKGAGGIVEKNITDRGTLIRQSSDVESSEQPTQGESTSPAMREYMSRAEEADKYHQLAQDALKRRDKKAFEENTAKSWAVDLKTPLEKLSESEKSQVRGKAYESMVRAVFGAGRSGKSNVENTNPLSGGHTDRGSVDAVSSEERVSTDIPPKVEVGAHGRFTHLLHKSYLHPETGKPLPAFLTEPSVRKAVGLPDVSPEEAKSTVETQKVREAIAQRMRAPRSSYLGPNGFQRFIDIHKNSLSNDAIDAYHQTVLEHENYGKKLDGFLTHPIADRILSEAQNGQIQRGAKTQLAQIAKQFGVSKASADAALESATSRANQATHAERGSVESKESTEAVESKDSRTESNLRRPANSTPESTETKSSSINARSEDQRASIEQKKSALLGLLRARDITRAEYDRRLSALNSGQDINVVTGNQSKISRFGARIRNFLENEQGSASLTRGDRSINIITGRPGMRVPTAEERKALKIPPAWTDVKIDDSPDARLIAIGKDTKGRTQRIYSAAHSGAALVAKFIRQREFNTSLPGLMERIHQDLNSRNAEEASVLRLIAMSGFRVGGEGDTGAKIKAYGASTLRTEHVKIEGDTVHFDFIGKLGVRQQHSIKDAGLAEDLQARLRRGGAVFQTNDTKVRNYLHSISEGKAYKVHDFRTWNATEAARRAVENMGVPTTPEEYWAKRDEVGDIAAVKIGDTRVIALESYIDPLVFEAWRESAGVEENATRPKQTRRKAGDVSRTNETNGRTLRDQPLRQRGRGEEFPFQREQVASRQLASSPRHSEAGFLNVSDLIKTFIFDPTRTAGGQGTKAIENTVAYIRAALLSNIPATPIKAVISLTAKAAIEEGVRPLSSLIDRAASRVLSMPRVVGGWHSRAMGESFVKTLKMGLPDAWKIMRGQSPTTPGAHNFPGVRTRFPLFDASVNTVTRIYGAKAAIFYTRAFYSEITQQAILQADKMIKAGSLAKGNRKQFIGQFINTPPPQSQILASQIAMRNIYMNENLASDITTGIKNGLTKAIPSVGRLIGHAMIPIDRVPSNAAIDLIFSQPIIGHAKALFQWKQAVDFMNKALATTNPRLAQDFTAAARVAQHEAAQTFAKASTIGALFILVGAMLAARGDAVSDKYDKRVRVPRTDYTASLIPFGLPGMLTGLGASMYQNMKGKDLSGMWTGLKASEKEALRDIPVIRELSDLASEDKSKPKPILDSAARLLIPQGIQSIGNLTDDVERTPQTNIQAIGARLPVLRRNVPASKFPEDKYKLFDPFKVRKEEGRPANRASGAPKPPSAPRPIRRTVN